MDAELWKLELVDRGGIEGALEVSIDRPEEGFGVSALVSPAKADEDPDDESAANGGLLENGEGSEGLDSFEAKRNPPEIGTDDGIPADAADFIVVSVVDVDVENDGAAAAVVLQTDEVAAEAKPGNEVELPGLVSKEMPEAVVTTASFGFSGAGLNLNPPAAGAFVEIGGGLAAGAAPNWNLGAEGTTAATADDAVDDINENPPGPIAALLGGGAIEATGAIGLAVSAASLSFSLS